MNDPLSSSKVEIPQAAMPPRFCRGCGAVWDVGWSNCPHCTNKMTLQANQSLEMTPSQATASSMWLYFALLMTLLPLAFEHKAPIKAQITVTAIHTAIILGWAAASWRDVKPCLRLPDGAAWLPIGAAAGLVSFAVVIGILQPLIAMGVPQLDCAPPFLKAGYGWNTIVLLCVIQPAIIEELAIRGVIFPALQRLMTNREAIIVSAMMFMALHLSPAMFPHTAIMGLIAGWLRVRTGSLYPCVLMHAVHNGLAIGIEYAQTA